MRRWLLALLCAFVFLAGCGRKPAAPAAAKIEPMARPALDAYLVKQIAKAVRDDAGNPDALEKNRTAYFGCLEKNKEDDCRFMLCSPYATYAGDELYQMRQYDDAFALYAGAYQLLRQEVTGTIERRKERENDFNDKSKSGAATEQDRRQYLFRRAILAHNLYRNYAEIARLLDRFALVFAKQSNDAEARNARSARDLFLQSSADEYADYFANRTALLPLLDPKSQDKGANYLAVIADMDGLLQVRSF